MQKLSRICKICLICKKEFSVQPHRKAAKFCSPQCNGLGLKGRKRLDISELNRKRIRSANPSWKGGISSIPYTIDWTETLRRSMRERDHYLCAVCKSNGNHVHHIDYDKKNCNPTNLITLCHSCHIKTNFNRDYWKSFFQNLLNN